MVSCTSSTVASRAQRSATASRCGCRMSSIVTRGLASSRYAASRSLRSGNTVGRFAPGLRSHALLMISSSGRTRASKWSDRENSRTLQCSPARLHDRRVPRCTLRNGMPGQSDPVRRPGVCELERNPLLVVDGLPRSTTDRTKDSTSSGPYTPLCSSESPSLRDQGGILAPQPGPVRVQRRPVIRSAASKGSVEDTVRRRRLRVWLSC